MFLKIHSWGYLLKYWRALFYRSGIWFQPSAIQKWAFHKISDHHSNFSQLFIFDFEVKPLVMCSCICIRPHIKFILLWSNFSNILQVSTLKVTLKYNLVLILYLSSADVVIYDRSTVLLHEFLCHRSDKILINKGADKRVVSNFDVVGKWVSLSIGRRRNRNVVQFNELCVGLTGETLLLIVHRWLLTNKYQSEQ